MPRTFQPLASPAPGVTTTGGTIICPNPNCGYQGPPQRVSRANTTLGCILCFFFILPGILYFMFRSGYHYVCPKCGLELRSDN